MKAAMHGKAKGPGPSEAVAKEFVDETPKSKKSLFSKKDKGKEKRKSIFEKKK